MFKSLKYLKMKLLNATIIIFSPSVASLCYKTSASLDRVVLDGFLTQKSSENICECTLNSSQNTTVSFKALNNLHPFQTSCGSSVQVVSAGATFIINCYIFGEIRISPSQPVTLRFEKPQFGYNSNYCMLLSPGKRKDKKNILADNFIQW